MKPNLNKLGLLILAATLSSAVTAEETTTANDKDVENLEVVTVTGQLSSFGAVKSDSPIVETSRSISIETSDQFYEKGAINLSQTTSYMSGVTAETYGFATRGDWVGARGLDLPRYRDSIQDLFGSYNTTRIEIYTLEQVEVLKGPASVLYGQGTPAGIFNSVSKTPKAESETEIVAEVGSYNRKQLAVDSTGELTDKWQYRFVALKRDSETQVDNVGDDSLVIMPSISYVPSETTRYTLLGQYQKNESAAGAQFIPVEGTLNPLADGSYLDQDVFVGEPGWDKYDTESRQLTALIEHEINSSLMLNATALLRKGEADYNQAWTVFTGAGQSRYLNTMLANFGVIPPGAPTGYSDTTVARSFYQTDNEFDQKAVDVRLTADFDTGDLYHQVLAGAQYQEIETDLTTAYFYGGGALQGDFRYVLDLANPSYTGAPDQAVFDALSNQRPTQVIKQQGVYVSDEISIDRVRITAGLRWDNVYNEAGDYDQTDHAISSSVGVLYAFDNGISPYINYSDSFQTVAGIDATTGEALEPQESTQFEGGVKYETSAFPGLFTLAYFDIEITNLDNPNALPNASSQQEGTATITGLEFEAKAEVGDFLIQAALNSLNTEDQNGYQYAGQPENGASTWVSWKPETGYRLGAGVRYVGQSISEAANVRYETPSYTLVDFMAGYEVNKNLDLALNVRNLTDKEYLTSCLTRGDCFPGVRRSVNGRVTYKF